MMIAVLSGLVVVTHHLTSFLLLPALACLACGVAGALVFAAAAPEEPPPLVGASAAALGVGAVSGALTLGGTVPGRTGTDPCRPHHRLTDRRSRSDLPGTAPRHVRMPFTGSLAPDRATARPRP